MVEVATAASLDVLRGEGFLQVGEQADEVDEVDEVDELELVLERPAG